MTESQDPTALATDVTIEEVGTTRIADEGDVAPAADPSADAAQHARAPRPSFRRVVGGVAAVGVKELRGRMRGRRAFVILTIYLLMLGGFAWMVELLLERTFTTGFGNSAAYASASIGQGIFAALMMLETLQVVFLAPASTAGGISLEREKQTLDMLITTPISSVAIVIGKLLSALVYVFLLIAASIPLTAVVFVYGGVGPDDVLRGYAILLVTALGLGSFGLFCSSLVKRTQAATAISIFGVLAISIGTLFILVFWTGIAQTDEQRGLGPIKGQPPAVLAYLNPFIAQADVMCGADTTPGLWCSVVNALVPNQNGVVFVNQGDFQGGPVAVPVPAFKGGGVVTDQGGTIIATDGNGNPLPTDASGNPIANDVGPFGVVRDTLWPKTVATWLILSLFFLFLSIQLVSPTRRWRPRLFRRRAPRGAAA